jgi:hypothetical protein
MKNKKFYCINFEEGCRTTPCPKVCSRCKGWLTKQQMNDLKQAGNKQDQDGKHKESNN